LFILFGDAQVVRFYNLLPFQKELEGQRLIDLKRVLQIKQEFVGVLH
jgi:hypothetical protein